MFILFLIAKIIFQFKFLLKKKNHGNLIEKKDLVYCLKDAKEQCKKTLENKNNTYGY